jgi:hypothetical protein
MEDRLGPPGRVAAFMAGEAEGARLRLPYDLGCAFAARIELTDLLPFIIEKCRNALAAEGVAVLLLDRVRHEFYLSLHCGHGFRGGTADFRLSLFRCTRLRRPRSSGKSLRIDDVQHDPRHYPGTEISESRKTRLSGQWHWRARRVCWAFRTCQV